MKLALFSDLHAAAGNLEHLLGILADQGIERIYNLGDAVGYSGDANRTFDLLRERGVISVVGNHDVEALAKPDPNMRIRTSGGRELGSDYGLTDQNKAYIRRLPRQLTEELSGVRFGVSHGLISQYAGAPLWESVTADNAAEFLEQVGADIAFAGNAHEQYYVELTGSRARQVEVESERELTLHSGRRYVISTGSAAAPSGVPAMPSFVVFEPQAKSVHFRKHTLSS